MAYDRSQAESEKPGSSAKVRYVVATDGDVGQRLDNFLLRELKGVPRTHVYRLLRKGEVRVNSKRARPDQRVAAGDRVRLPPVRRPDPVEGVATARRAAARGDGRDRLRGRGPDRDQQAGGPRRARRQRALAWRDRGAARGTPRAWRARSRASAGPRDERMSPDREASRGASRSACAAARRASREALSGAGVRPLAARPQAHRARARHRRTRAAASATSRCAATVRWR